VQKKRLSWGKSKVLEFFKERRDSSGNIEEEVNPRPFSCRDRNARRGSPRPVRVLHIADEYELPIHSPNNTTLQEESKDSIKVEVQQQIEEQQESHQNKQNQIQDF
jgi:hypothetical protein